MKRILVRFLVLSVLCLSLGILGSGSISANNPRGICPAQCIGNGIECQMFWNDNTGQCEYTGVCLLSPHCTVDILVQPDVGPGSGFPPQP